VQVNRLGLPGTQDPGSSFPIASRARFRPVSHKKWARVWSA